MSKAPIDKLAMMTNEIAAFFRSYPHDEAVVHAGSAGPLAGFQIENRLYSAFDAPSAGR